MSWRFRIKAGPFVYDEKLGGVEDRRPALLTRGDFVVLFLAGCLLAFAVVAMIWL